MKQISNTSHAELNDMINPIIPDNTIGALYRYYVYGYQPGGFLSRVITGDDSAINYADKENVAVYGYICKLVQELNKFGDSPIDRETFAKIAGNIIALPQDLKNIL
jgi:hypothetical protein